MPSLLADPGQRGELATKASCVQRLLSDKNVVIKIGGAKTSSVWSPEQIAEGLGLLVAAVLKGIRPASLFLSGGDTATAVLAGIGATGIRLLGEIVPGVAEGRIIGNFMDGLPVVTKAGAFGKEDTLVAVHEYWLRKGKERSI
jgi:uncharacterized protein YgbK (DUF1537 family)